jgi:hypothetical protein
MARALEFFDRLLRWTCIILMGLMSAFVIASVILRYSFNPHVHVGRGGHHDALRSDHLLRLALATQRGEHITMNWFDNLGGHVFTRLRFGRGFVRRHRSVGDLWRGTAWKGSTRLATFFHRAALADEDLLTRCCPSASELIALFELVRLAGPFRAVILNGKAAAAHERTDPLGPLRRFSRARGPDRVFFSGTSSLATSSTPIRIWSA